MKEKIKNLFSKYTKLHSKSVNNERFFIENYVHIKEEKKILVDFLNDRYGQKYRQSTKPLCSSVYTRVFFSINKLPNFLITNKYY